MRIADLIPTRKPFLSLEFFPPKERDTWPKFFEEVEKLKVLDPLFVSVTYGAGGGTQANTLDIVTRLKNDLGLEPMAHLTCVGASSEGLHGFLAAITEAGGSISIVPLPFGNNRPPAKGNALTNR